MIMVNFRDGTTLSFDLEDEDEFKQWEEWVEVEDFQSKVTGIGIIYNKRFYALSRPKNFRRARVGACLIYVERGGVRSLKAEKLWCVVDDIEISVQVYTYDNPPPPTALRMDVRKLKTRGWSRKDIYPLNV